MSDPTTAIHTYLTTAPTSGFLHQPVEMVDHWQGRDNLLWRVRTAEGDAVVKMYLDAGQVRSRRQRVGQQLFSAFGLAPEPLWEDRTPEGLPRQVLVYRWAEGEPLDLADPLHRDALAEGLAFIHRQEPELVQRFSPHPINLATFWQIWSASEEALARWVTRASAPGLSSLLDSLWRETHPLIGQALPLFGETRPALIHGEMSVENVLIRRGRCLFLDWEFFGLGDPAQEVARFLFYSGPEWSEAEQAAWLERYLAAMNEPVLEERIQLYRRVFPFHAATNLLHGLLQELAASPAAAQELADHAEMFVETAAASLARAAQDLGTGPLSQEDQAQLRAELADLLKYTL